MSDSVLCAIDINQPNRAANILKMAAKLAKMDDAQLDVITVIPDFGTSLVSGFFTGEQQKLILDEAKKELKEQVAAVLGDETSTRHIVSTGSSYQEILKTAEKAKSTLIVVGGALKPDFSDYLIGPTAARVIRHATCSVHVVR